MLAFFSISFSDFSIKRQIVEILSSRVLFKKLEFRNDSNWITTDKLADLITIEFIEARLYLNEGKGKILIQNINNSLPRLKTDAIEWDLCYSLISEIIENCKSITFAYMHNNVDYVLNNTEDIKSWEAFGKAVPEYAVFIKNPSYKENVPGMDMIQKELISVESLPGHTHQMSYEDMLWFGCCWQMYFSPTYYKYIPRPLFDDFMYCYENVILTNGLRKVTLYKNIEDFDSLENRKIQWRFRREMGIDSIAHEITKANNRIEPLDLPVVITKLEAQIGQTRVERFLDDNGKLVIQSKARKMEIKEYKNDGVSIVYEDVKNLQ